MKDGSYKSWIGRTLGGRYEILDIIEEGGMGVVYRARQIAIDREVAIKMLRAHVADEPRWVERFHREAKACSCLAHPNTIRLYDYGQTTRGEFYMAMELLQGRSLHTLINEEAPISAPRVLRILMQCCASLSEAHAMGIIHRDIKPENIYIQQLAGTRDFVKLFDFSIAKHTDLVLTAVGTIIGTPEYMSPEQANGESVDHRSDIYSLGVVAYIMLKGELLFHSPIPLDILKMHQSKVPPPLPASVPAPVARLIMSCLAKNPDDRPNTALELLEAAQVWLSNLDPAVDLASDPAVRDTLLTMNATADMSESEMAMPAKPVMRTMLGTVGALTDFGTASFGQPKPRPRTMLHSAGGPGTAQTGDDGEGTTNLSGIGIIAAGPPDASANSSSVATAGASAVAGMAAGPGSVANVGLTIGASSGSVPAGVNPSFDGVGSVTDAQGTRPVAGSNPGIVHALLPRAPIAADIHAEEMTAQVKTPGIAKVAPDQELLIFEKRKSPLFWTVCALLLLGGAAGAYFLITTMR